MTRFLTGFVFLLVFIYCFNGARVVYEWVNGIPADWYIWLSAVLFHFAVVVEIISQYVERKSR